MIWEALKSTWWFMAPVLTWAGILGVGSWKRNR